MHRKSILSHPAISMNLCTNTSTRIFELNTPILIAAHIHTYVCISIKEIVQNQWATIA